MDFNFIMKKKGGLEEYWMQWEWDVRLKDAYKVFWNRWDWEWFCSLPLDKGNYSDAQKILKVWNRDLAKGEHVQVASMGIYTTIPIPHIHLLALGKNKDGKTLFDVAHKKWEKHWSRLTKHKAVIEPIYHQDGAVHYISHLNTPPDHSEMIDPYNKRLLRKDNAFQCK